jgi:hypothetical protein
MKLDHSNFGCDVDWFADAFTLRTTIHGGRRRNWRLLHNDFPAVVEGPRQKLATAARGDYEAQNSAASRAPRRAQFLRYVICGMADLCKKVILAAGLGTPMRARPEIILEPEQADVSKLGLKR